MGTNRHRTDRAWDAGYSSGVPQLTVPTPALVVDLDILDRNIAAMADIARSRGLRLRPHAKTHKCIEIARRQLAAGAVGLTVATVSEAEVFAKADVEDLFIAYPLWVDAARGARLRALAERITLTVGVDSESGARALAGHAGSGMRVLVEVDSGHHRTGVSPDNVVDVARSASDAGLRVAGVFTFPGHSYGPGLPRPVAEEEAAALSRAASALERAGFAAAVVSGGSTPTAHLTRASAMTELRPGVYVFGDAQQYELGTCPAESIALTALATVVSTSGDQVVLDAGSKVLGADRPAWTTGFGRILDCPDARITALSEHHATVVWPGDRPTVGEAVRVVPNHVCSAVNLADELIVASSGRMVDRWAVAARGCNT